MNGRIVAAVCNRHALFETWPGVCNRRHGILPHRSEQARRPIRFN